MGKLVSLGDFKIEAVEDEILIEIKQIKKELGMTHYDVQCILIIENQKFRSNTQYFSFGSTDYFKFLSDLSNMYFALEGKTELKSYDYPGIINISVIDRGYFLIEGEITQQYSINGIQSKNSHKFKFSLNQTYFERIAKKYKGINNSNWEDYFCISENL